MKGQVTYTLLRAYEYAKDNRLLPAGFDKNSADVPTSAYMEPPLVTADFIGGSDQIVYEISNVPIPVTVTVELLFQALSYPFVADLSAIETASRRQLHGALQPGGQCPRGCRRHRDNSQLEGISKKPKPDFNANKMNHRLEMLCLVLNWPTYIG